MLASDLIKGNHIFKRDQKLPVSAPHPLQTVASPQSTKSETSSNQSEIRQQLYPQQDGRDEEVFAESKIGDSNNNNNYNNNNNNNNNNSNNSSDDRYDVHDDNNNNSNKHVTANGSSTWKPKQSLFASKSISTLPSIKEESRSKLENQIKKLRDDQENTGHEMPGYLQKANSPYNDSNNNSSDNPKNAPLHHHERSTVSHVPIIGRRTEQYCN